MQKILLVEDNDLNRDMMTRLLHRWGYEVLCAMEGHTALKLAESGHPDLVLMDISLPGMDGYETTTRLRAMPEGKDVPIIALTAHVLEEDRTHALLAGCNDFEPKPIDFPLLLEKLQKHLGTRKP
jgi:two-component system, cell cycle response regulator DivK